MLYFHGFDEFIRTEKLSHGNINKKETKVISSWCSIAVFSDNGSLNIEGFQAKWYHRILKEVGAHISTDCTFMDTNLIIVGKTGDIHLLSDNQKCYPILLDWKHTETPQIQHVYSTEQDLLVTIDTKTCFICKNVFSEIQRKIHETMSQPIPTVKLPIFELASSIAEVSCGKEHVLLLTAHGTVLSFGGGSRGQLGHGTIDCSTEPKLVETLAGLKMITVAAGGWHSLCISECHDVYCWGWNESGQLGLPSNSVREKHNSSLNQDKGHSVHSDIKRKTSKSQDSNEPEHLKCMKTDSVIPNATDILPDKEKTIQTCDSTMDKHESLIFIQDVDPVQVQSVPCLIDLQDKFDIHKVSCGSRHSAIISDKGILLTSGWNDYGQLCQEDKVTRDYFETVSSYIKSETKIQNVFCGVWSTTILTGNS